MVLGRMVFKFDVDTRHVEKIIDLTEDEGNWKLYGSSMRVHPVTDEIYMSLYHEFSIPTYVTRRYTVNGDKIRDYEMISNYWFPSIPIFAEDPAAMPSGVEGIGSGSDTDSCTNAAPIYYDLQGNRVENPEHGIYIRVAGGKATKITL